MSDSRQISGFLMHPKDIEKLRADVADAPALTQAHAGSIRLLHVLGIRLIPNEWLAEGSKPIPLTAEDIAERTWERRVRREWGEDESYLRCEKDDK